MRHDVCHPGLLSIEGGIATAALSPGHLESSTHFIRRTGHRAYIHCLLYCRHACVFLAAAAAAVARVI